MTRSWPGGLNSSEVERRIGPLRSLFLSGSSEWLAAVIFALISLLIGLVLCYLWLSDAKAAGLWMAWTPVFAFSALSWSHAGIIVAREVGLRSVIKDVPMLLVCQLNL